MLHVAGRKAVLTWNASTCAPLALPHTGPAPEIANNNFSFRYPSRIKISQCRWMSGIALHFYIRTAGHLDGLVAVQWNPAAERTMVSKQCTRHCDHNQPLRQSIIAALFCLATHPRRAQMRPTLVSTGKSCRRSASSKMHAALLRPRPSMAMRYARASSADTSRSHSSDRHPCRTKQHVIGCL
jgi:hypothetical protein